MSGAGELLCTASRSQCEGAKRVSRRRGGGEGGFWRAGGRLREGCWNGMVVKTMEPVRGRCWLASGKVCGLAGTRAGSSISCRCALLGCACNAGARPGESVAMRSGGCNASSACLSACLPMVQRLYRLRCWALLMRLHGQPRGRGRGRTDLVSE